jgi:hypothetical protein
VTGQRRTAVPGVTDEHDPTTGPFGYDDLARAVEVEVVRVGQGLEDVVGVPAESLEALRQEGLLGGDIAPVIAEDGGAEAQ